MNKDHWKSKATWGDLVDESRGHHGDNTPITHIIATVFGGKRVDPQTAMLSTLEDAHGVMFDVWSETHVYHNTDEAVVGAPRNPTEGAMRIRNE